MRVMDYEAALAYLLSFADFERTGRFQERHTKIVLRQRQRRREPADAGARDDHGARGGHGSCLRRGARVRRSALARARTPPVSPHGDQGSGRGETASSNRDR